MSTSIDVRRTTEFSEFLHSLKDHIGKAAILARLKRLERGNWGDAAPVGDGVTELRINTGPGYRVYCVKVGDSVVVALAGGTKRNQQADINAAKAAAKELQ